MSGLTKNQKIFCDEYLIDLNATRAYKEAYKRVTKDATAAAASSRLLRNVKVEEYIKKKMRKREERTEITQDEVLKELAKIGFADIKDYLEYKTSKGVVDYDMNGEPIVDYRVIIDLIDSKDVDTSAIQEISIGRDGTFKFKMYDKQKALVDIGKHLGMFDDKDYKTAQIKKIIAETELTKERTKLLKGTKKDTSLLEALIDVVKEDE